MNQLSHLPGVAVDRRFFFLMSRANRALLSHVNARALEELGVSSAQLGALYHVAKHPGCTMTEVADVLDLNKSAASGLVARLETSQALRREPNPKDGRGQLLFLTKKGESIRTQSLPLVRRLTSEITAGFSDAEVETVFRFLNGLVERYADDGQEEST